ncbi:substrate binding domain-containing protein [Dongshaea marina]|uniref:substrate binding domain-containing protein n=1 Tax=Dongshaea marina TaxID=2047966 RepID=UPI000D3EE109|nr:substrate binding domain-containing protein [Dongshaea marina]
MFTHRWAGRTGGKAYTGGEGLVRITAPLWFGSHRIAPRLPELKHKWPELSLQLDYNIEAVDPYLEEYDLYVQITDPKDSSLVARPLESVEYWLCASNGYIEKFGTPLLPDELSSHQLLKQSAPKGYSGWHFFDADDQCQHIDTSRGWLSSNTSISLQQAALNGAGIVMLSRELLERHVQLGQMQRLFQDYRCAPYHQGASLFLVYAKGKTQEPRVRVVVEQLIKHLGE